MYNVFVPLVPLTACNGPTELRPGSHLHGGNTWGEVAPRLAPLLGTGDMLIFDYRLRHRGLANNSSRQHPNPNPNPNPNPDPNNPYPNPNPHPNPNQVAKRRAANIEGARTMGCLGAVAW